MRVQIELNCITEKGCVVTLFPLGMPILGSILVWGLVFGVPACILLSKIDCHEDLQTNTHGDHRDQNGVAVGEFGGVFAEVDKSCNSTTEITYTNYQYIESSGG